MKKYRFHVLLQFVDLLLFAILQINITDDVVFFHKKFKLLHTKFKPENYKLKKLLNLSKIKNDDCIYESTKRVGFFVTVHLPMRIALTKS